MASAARRKSNAAEIALAAIAAHNRELNVVQEFGEVQRSSSDDDDNSLGTRPSTPSRTPGPRGEDNNDNSDSFSSDWGAESLDGGVKLERLLDHRRGLTLSPTQRGRRKKDVLQRQGSSVRRLSSSWSKMSNPLSGVTAATTTTSDGDASYPTFSSPATTTHNPHDPSSGEAQQRRGVGRSNARSCKCWLSCRWPYAAIPHALRHRSFYCLRGANPLRVFLFRLVHHKLFELLVILVICASCVWLALDDPTRSDTDKPDWHFYVELGFAVFYTIEMILKMIALGFILHRGSYFSDPWNRLDAMIVTFTWLAFVPGVGNYSALRVLRVLRPLRSMNAVKGLKILVIALLQSLKSLWPVMLLAAIVFSIFSVVATQLWSGLFHNVCVPVIDPNASSIAAATFTRPANAPHLATAVPPYDSSLFRRRCNPDAWDSDEWLGLACPRGFECVGGFRNPGLGFVSYDHAGWALLATFQVITFESWPYLYRTTLEAGGQIVFVYYFFVLLIGAYFIPNLAVAVINDRYHDAIAKQRELSEAADAAAAAVAKREQEEATRRASFTRGMTFKLTRAKSRLDSAGVMRTTSDSMLAIEPKTSGISRARRPNNNNVTTSGRTPASVTFAEAGPRQHTTVASAPAVTPPPYELPAPTSASSGAALHKHDSGHSVRSESKVIMSFAHNNSASVKNAPPRSKSVLSDDLNATRSSDMSNDDLMRRPVVHLGPSCWLSFRNFLHRVTQGCPLPEYTVEVALADHQGASGTGLTVADLDLASEDTTLRLDQRHTVVATSSSVATATAGAAIAAKLRTREEIKRHRRRMTVFTAFIILCIFVNTAILAAQHHDQPKWLDVWTERANWAFLGIFVFELIITIVAVGFRRFFTSAFFVLDLIVVIASIVELFVSGSTILTVFRTLRLLRPLKLVRNAPSLQAVVHVMIDAVRDTLYVNLVLFLVILVFSLAGMQIFGGKMDVVEKDFAAAAWDQPSVEVRARFNTFLSAFFAVFQVVTTDNWTDVMWQAMYGVHPLAALYFVVLVLLGYYVVIALFLSILIQGFEREADRTHRDRDGDSSDDDDEGELERADDLEHIQKQIQAKAFEQDGPFVGGADADGVVDTHDESVTVLVASEREIKEREGDARLQRIAPIVNDLFRTFGDVPETALALALQAEQEAYLKMTEAMPVTNFVCTRCGSRKQRVLTAPPFVQKRSPHDVHDLHCALVSRRRDREHFLHTLLAAVHDHMQKNSILSDDMTFALLKNAHNAKCFIKLEERDLRSWRDIRDEAREELAVLRLGVGEEQLGRAHVSYVYKGLKLRQETNGSTSLFLFGPENRFRAALTSLTQHWAFDAVILLLITLSTVVLIIDSPRNDLSDDVQFYITWIDFGFNCLFAAEIVLKVVALGLVLHPGAYLRNGWHWLDVVSVAVSFVAEFSAVRALRMLRFIRPLRSIRRYRGLRIVASTIIMSIKGIVHVVLLSFVSYLVFGILGVQLFGGKFYSCNDATITTKSECDGFFTETVLVYNDALAMHQYVQYTQLRRWERFSRNFDNIGSSMLTLFQVSTGDDWADVMYAGIDAVSTTQTPERDHQPWMGFFFIVFYIVSNFFFVSLFVGVVIVNFSKVKQKVDGVAFLTDEQRAWVDSQRAILQMRPEPMLLAPGSGRFRKWLDSVVRGAKFELFIALCIALNVLAIASEYPGQSSTHESILQYISWVFASLFFVEMLIKLTAHGFRYFLLSWNRFDGFLAVIGLVTMVLEILSEDQHSSYIPVNLSVLRGLRFIRVLRVLRLFKKARRVRVLVETLWHSLPSIANISLLLFLVYVVFAVIGVQLFTYVRPGGRFLDEEFFNFHTFPNALQLLFIFTTNEKWSDAMYDLMLAPPYCDETSSTTNACGLWYAPAFFVPFVIIASLLITNLFLAIILDNFSTTMKLDQSNVTLADLHRFVDVWSMFDPDATGLIPTRLLPRLLAALQPPLGTTRSNSRVELLRRMASYRILDHDGRVHFAEVIVPLARQAMTHGSSSEGQLHGFDVKAWGFDDIDELPVCWYEFKPAHTGHTLAASYVAACYRRYVARRKFLQDRQATKAAKAQGIAAPLLAAASSSGPVLAPRKQRRSLVLQMEDF